MPPTWAARLAVVGSPELDQEGAVLTAVLSQNSELEVLERAEVAQLVKEQNLEATGITAKDSVRLGQLLKADGLVILEKNETGLSGRLVDVDSGAILLIFSAPIPVIELEGWCNRRATDIGQLATKLALGENHAVPLSLMTINSASGGKQAAILEDNLNTMLAARLLANPNLLVLERRSLQVAISEKELGAETKSFLNGAWIMDGTITELNPGFSLDLRLQPPGNREDQKIRLEGMDLNGLVEKADGEILRILQLPTERWQPAKEAGRFVEEAMWASRNGMWAQAAQAIEVAVAFGENSPKILRFRWKCYDRLSRHNPGSWTSGFAGAKGQRPSVTQMAHMARAVKLAGESLKTASPLPMAPTSLYQFGGGPEAESARLLHDAGRLIAVEEKRRPDEIAAPPELQELRDEMHRLYSAILQTWPELALKPRANGDAPRWSARPIVKNDDAPWWSTRPIVKSLVSEPANEPKRTIHIERLENGRLWESQATAYFAFVKECLISDLPSDPFFFQTVLEIIDSKSAGSTFSSEESLRLEWVEAGKVLAKDSSTSCQIGAATILCRTGEAGEGIEIYSRREDDALSGTLPMEYLAAAFAEHVDLRMTMRLQRGVSATDLVGEFKDLLVRLFSRGFVPSTDLLGKLRIRFSEKQAEELLASFQPIVENPGTQPSPEQWAIAATGWQNQLSKWARKSPQSQPLPQKSTSSKPKPNTNTKIVSVPQNSLKVDLAWAAKSFLKPNSSGVIRWAHPIGNRIWMQTESPGAQGKLPRRAFRYIEVPSMQSRVVFRDAVPLAVEKHPIRQGPTFATDGEGVYFWNGSGLSYARDKTSKVLNVPELNNPFFWMVEGKLYIADQAGVILRYDPKTDSHEILASQRRRPPQSVLDEEKDLKNVSRIFRREDGSVALLLGASKIFLYREEKHNWEPVSHPSLRPSPGELLSLTINDWDLAARDSSILVDAYFREKARATFKLIDLRSLSSEDRMQALRAQVRPLEKYMTAQWLKEKNPPIVVEAGSAIGGVLWCLLSEFGNKQNFLLKLNPETEEFFCRSLNFNPEFLAYTKGGGAAQRILPLSDGFALYKPNSPVIWFIPEADLSSNSE